MRKIKFNDKILFALLLFITFINIVCFFYIKNSAYYFRLNVNKLSSEVLSEKNNLSIKKAEFNEKYSVHNLQELAQNKLNLQFSNIKQIVDFDDVLKK